MQTRPRTIHDLCWANAIDVSFACDESAVSVVINIRDVSK